jgi:hypothetical protein
MSQALAEPSFIEFGPYRVIGIARVARGSQELSWKRPSPPIRAVRAWGGRGSETPPYGMAIRVHLCSSVDSSAVPLPASSQHATASDAA